MATKALRQVAVACIMSLLGINSDALAQPVPRQAVQFPGNSPILIDFLRDTDSTTAMMRLDRSSQAMAGEACYALYGTNPQQLDPCLLRALNSRKGTVLVYANCATRALSVVSGEPEMNSHAIWNSVVDRSVALELLCPGRLPVRNIALEDLSLVVAFRRACQLRLSDRDVAYAIRQMEGVTVAQFRRRVEGHRIEVRYFERNIELANRCREMYDLMEKHQEILTQEPN